MSVSKVVTGNYAAAYGALLSRIQFAAAYPITPQTFIVEHLSEFVHDGLLDADYVRVESEHSAMSAVVAAEATGVRSFTATSSQGLALMHEVLFLPSALRLPIVMPVVNRTVAAPIGIWCEYNDTMPQRDSGWIQAYVEDNQEVLDMVIQAYKIAENKDVLLPMMLSMDAFILSHTVEPVEFPDQEAVDAFLPSYKAEHAHLWPEDPMIIGSFTPPEYIQEVRYQTDQAMKAAREVIKRVTKDFASAFGRDYGGLVEEYRTDDAEVVLVTLGTVTSTARDVVDEMRDEGKKVGMVKLRYFRPYPFEEIRKVAEDVSAIGFYDRSISYGSGGPSYIEGRHALYGLEIPVMNFLAGLGGRDVRVPDIKLMFEKLLEAAREGKAKKDIVWIGTRGVEP
ncbi:MAG TPA: pyruvate ferredoxin oxidoreductase [Euryarchaeota archaeon]|nr:MAG: pyruvate ferredoxin oxidoreductase [Thermoplasmata archaeon]HDD60173.1 pyruvate ferredoxin oxidoreductase [Euryarchaeota archaeon]